MVRLRFRGRRSGTGRKMDSFVPVAGGKDSVLGPRGMDLAGAAGVRSGRGQAI